MANLHTEEAPVGASADESVALTDWSRSRSISRRSFVAGTAATLALCALPSTAFAVEDAAADAAAAVSPMGGAHPLANSWRYQDGVPAAQQETASDAMSLLADKWSLTDQGYVNSVGDLIPGAIRKGVDVSEWQYGIDWDAAYADGVNFAIIRCGYGDNYWQQVGDQDDAYWIRNVSECERLDIPYGVYLYSYAYNEEMAYSELAHVLRLLNGIKKIDPSFHGPTLPVYLDMEDSSTIPAGNDMLLKIATIFCEGVRAAGYTPGVYANLNWWNTYLTSDKYDQWERWVAQYNVTCDYDGPYNLWQCTSMGVVDGIVGVNGYVDLNFDFGLYPRDVAEDDWYVKDGSYSFVLARNIMKGDSNTGDFMPYDSVTRGQVATILWRLAGSPKATADRFEDVNYDLYYGDAIMWARAKGVITGDQEADGTHRTFRPDDSVQRQELAIMLCNYTRIVGGQSVSASHSAMNALPDASQVDSWARDQMAWAVDRGIITGSVENGAAYLLPQSPAQRCAMAKMVRVLLTDVI